MAIKMVCVCVCALHPVMTKSKIALKFFGEIISNSHLDAINYLYNVCIVDNIHFILSFIKSVSKCCGGWLIDHSQYIQASNLTSILRCLRTTYNH